MCAGHDWHREATQEAAQESAQKERVSGLVLKLGSLEQLSTSALRWWFFVGTYRHSSERSLPPVPQLPVTPEATLKQKAVAKLKLFNFTLNWDLQMTQCRPCG